MWPPELTDVSDAGFEIEDEDVEFDVPGDGEGDDAGVIELLSIESPGENFRQYYCRTPPYYCRNTIVYCHLLSSTAVYCSFTAIY